MDTADQNSESLRMANRKHHSSAFAPICIQALLLKMCLFACMWSQRITGWLYLAKKARYLQSLCHCLSLTSALHGKKAFTRCAPDLMEQARTDLYRIFPISDPAAETFTITFKDLSGI